MTRVAFVTNICPHYRVKTFEELAKQLTVEYYFFSAGDDWYWQLQHGAQRGRFECQYLPGFRIINTRVTPSLPWLLWHNHYDVIVKCINGRFALPVTFLTARLQRKPFVLWTGIWMRIQTPVHRAFFRLTRYIYRHSDAIVVYGTHVGRYLIAEGVRPERIFVSCHAVDNEAYNGSVPSEEVQALRHHLDINPDLKVILYLGRLEEGKGLPELLTAFAQLRPADAVLVLAGTGSQQAELIQIVRDTDLTPFVRFAGYIPVAQTVAYYAMAWVSIVPSVTTKVFKEPWGLVVNEAFNQGLPVIATDAVGAAAGGLVQHGVNGLVVPEKNPVALADAIRLLLDNPALRDAFSENARFTIQQWTDAGMASTFVKAIEHAIDNKNS